MGGWSDGWLFFAQSPAFLNKALGQDVAVALSLEWVKSLGPIAKWTETQWFNHCRRKLLNEGSRLPLIGCDRI